MNLKYQDAFLRIFGVGRTGVLLSILVEIPVFLISLARNLLPMKISSQASFLAGTVFLIGFFLLNIWALEALPFEKRDKRLVQDGPYKYIRNPSSSAMAFLLLPSFALFLRVWLPVLFIPLIICLWVGPIVEEEKRLKKDLGRSYEKYLTRTGRFIPKINF